MFCFMELVVEPLFRGCAVCGIFYFLLPAKMYLFQDISTKETVTYFTIKCPTHAEYFINSFILHIYFFKVKKLIRIILWIVSIVLVRVAEIRLKSMKGDIIQWTFFVYTAFTSGFENTNKIPGWLDRRSTPSSSVFRKAFT